MDNILNLRVHRLESPVSEIQFSVGRIFNAGWAGSDRAAIQHHIDELAEMGVPAPQFIPTLFALGKPFAHHQRRYTGSWRQDIRRG